MIRSVAPLVAAALLAPASHAQLTLVWSDEFDGTSINPANWEHQLGTGTLYGLPAGWGNNEWQTYTDDPANSYVSGGNLHIVARRTTGNAYTSARLRSKNLQDFLYGRIEARIKLPSGDGVWPAFWMLPTASPYGIWAASGEMDIVESVNTATTVYGTAHFGGEWPEQTANGGTYDPGVNLSDDFHVYAIEWEPDQIRWYFDGILYHTLNSSQWYSLNDLDNDRAPFDVPFHMLLNVAVGGDWPGSPSGVGFPMEMVVDYVRVYQVPPPVQEPFFGAPHAIPGTVEAEDYDLGGQTVAYLDEDAANNGGAYRTDEGVDIQPCGEGGYNVGWVREGEWIEYTIDVQSAGDYQIDARVASNSTGGIFRLEFSGDSVTTSTPTFIVPVTGGWQAWTTSTVTATLEAGEQVMRFVNDGSAASEYNVSRFDFTLLTPPPGCAGDLDGDGDTDVFDFGRFGPAFGAAVGDPEYIPEADLDGSGTIDVFDFSLFGPNFGCTS